MNVYEKLNQAITKIKTTKIKKLGHNTFSGYKYYTPEQIDQLVYGVCNDLKLFVKFDLKRNELGVDGHLEIINIEDINESICYLMASAIPSIKATNDAQQLGGAMTYTKRYMLMNAFDITENSLDFDDKRRLLNKYDKDNKEYATYWTIINAAKEKSMTIETLEIHYKVSAELRPEIIEDLK